jgi:hypothetical protein
MSAVLCLSCFYAMLWISIKNTSVCLFCFSVQRFLRSQVTILWTGTVIGEVCRRGNTCFLCWVSGRKVCFGFVAWVWLSAFSTWITPCLRWLLWSGLFQMNKAGWSWDPFPLDSFQKAPIGASFLAFRRSGLGKVTGQRRLSWDPWLRISQSFDGLLQECYLSLPWFGTRGGKYPVNSPARVDLLSFQTHPILYS